MTARVEQFAQFVRELTSHRNEADRPDYEMRDHLVWRMTRDLANLTPADDERLRILIRRRTGT